MKISLDTFVFLILHGDKEAKSLNEKLLDKEFDALVEGRSKPEFSVRVLHGKLVST